MATIVSSKNAPTEAFTVTFGAGSVSLGGDAKPYETDDTALISEASRHPWLEVQPAKVKMLGGEVKPPSVDPKKDPLSAQNPLNALINDPDAVAKADMRAEDEAPAAVEPTLKQDKSVTKGGVDKTVAAANHSTEKDG